ncbi:MAG: zinc ribbon domain-containing protein [Bacilli bacterium]|nr:zinc ribbon domain-containing protein [Bacilli bacterium]MDD4733435.1 zinc ribbon domain-containing protein [Bacilli bacterium]
MKCEKCGTPIITGEEFCRICGNKYEKLENVEVLGITDNVEANVLEKIIDNEVTDVKEELSVDEDIEKPKSKLNQNDSDVEMIIKKNNFNPLIIVLAILFLASLVLNILLIINKDKEEVNLIVNEETMKTVYIDNYKYDIPYDWSYEKKDNLIFSDKTSNWGFSVQIEEMEYSNIKTNKDDFYKVIKDADIEITSDYEKSVNNKDNLLFKGKQGKYNTYVIVTNVGSNKIALTKILFKSEVDDILLNKALDVVTTLEISNDSIVSGEFTFEGLESYLSKLNIIKEEVEKN